MHGPAQHGLVRDAIAGVANLYREWIDSGKSPTEERWAAAGAAARAAAWRTMADRMIMEMEACPAL